MSLFNIFKKKKEKPKEEKETEVIKEEIVSKKKETGFPEASLILKSPHITEKASSLASQNQYIFKVFSQANKIQIKKAIEKIYGVDVESVRIINIPSKLRRLGRIEGKKPGYKKAIVKIKSGQKIEILPR